MSRVFFNAVGGAYTLEAHAYAEATRLSFPLGATRRLRCSYAMLATKSDLSQKTGPSTWRATVPLVPLTKSLQGSADREHPNHLAPLTRLSGLHNLDTDVFPASPHPIRKIGGTFLLAPIHAETPSNEKKP